MNKRLGTVCIMPLTSGGRPARFRITSRFQRRPGLLLADQLRNLDKSRFKVLLGRIDEKTLSAALGVLREMFED